MTVATMLMLKLKISKSPNSVSEVTVVTFLFYTLYSNFYQLLCLCILLEKGFKRLLVSYASFSLSLTITYVFTFNRSIFILAIYFYCLSITYCQLLLKQFPNLFPCLGIGIQYACMNTYFCSSHSGSSRLSSFLIVPSISAARESCNI